MSFLFPIGLEATSPQYKNTKQKPLLRQMGVLKKKWQYGKIC
jgi:hypothetical protein